MKAGPLSMTRLPLFTQLCDVLALALANWRWRRIERLARAPSLVVDDVLILTKRSD
jgi:hypothetical protein